MFTDFSYALAALAAVVGAILLGARLLQARAPRISGPAGRPMRLEAVLALDGRRRLHLVSCEGRRLVLLTGGDGDLVVGWLPEQADP